QPNEGIVTHQNLVMVVALRAGAELADVAGDSDTAARFRDRADTLARAIDTHLWSDEAGAYIDAIHTDGTRSDTISVHCQMYAL
ncbi:hypothetical protein GPV29_24210, partial [Salmonella enterica subsp. enterica serovar Typhimurium]|uniref:MGH1-like glycoside hydrolase domain-containing protein n=1 Tax=Salmonella enterica TaxID=28901 RepID=UPI0015CBCC30